MSPAAIARERERARIAAEKAAATPIAESKPLANTGPMSDALKAFARRDSMLGDHHTPMTREAVNDYADKLVAVAERIGVDPIAIKNAALNFQEGSTELPPILVEATKALQTTMFGELAADTSPEAQALRQSISDTFGGKPFERVAVADGIAGPCTLGVLDYMVAQAAEATAAPTVAPVTDGMDPVTTPPTSGPTSAPTGQTTDQAFQAKLASLTTVPAIEREIANTERVIGSMRGQVPQAVIDQYSGQLDQLKAKRDAIARGVAGFTPASGEGAYTYGDLGLTDVKGNFANGQAASIHYDVGTDTFTINSTNGGRTLTTAELEGIQKQVAAQPGEDAAAFNELLTLHLEIAHVSENQAAGKGVTTFKPDAGEDAITPTSDGTRVNVVGTLANGTRAILSYDANTDTFTVQVRNHKRPLNDAELAALMPTFAGSSTPDASGFAALIENHLTVGTAASAA